MIGGSGNMAILTAMMIAGVFIFIILSGVFIQNQACAQNMLVITPAVDIANQIENYPEVSGTDCVSLLMMISNGNSIILTMNTNLGTNFDYTNVAESCSVALQYAPVLGTYNSVIVSAQQVDPNNATSITTFYENIFQLAADYFIVNGAIDSAGFKLAWSGTAELNDGLKLEKIVSLCGDVCYAALLSQIHWFIRNNFDNEANDFMSWATNYLQPKSCT